MKRMKTICIFIFLIFGFTSLMGLTTEVKGAIYSIGNGTEWTTRIESSSANGKVSYKVTTFTGTEVRGDIREINDDGRCNELLNQDLTGHIYSREFVDGALASVSTLENVTYAEKTVEAYVSTTLPGYSYIAVVNATGIVLNITTTGLSLWLVSWKFESCPLAIPGYELLILLGITTVATLGIIIYIRKKQLINLTC